MRANRALSLVFLGLVSLVSVGWANSNPDCLDTQGKVLSLDNSRALELKTQGKPGVPYRGYVSGTVTRVFGQQCGQKYCHNHFEIKIGTEAKDVIEVIYNNDFGPMPDPVVGTAITACGDIINTIGQTRGRPSPSGAIIHWVHQSDTPQTHPSGFVTISSILYN